MFKAFRLAALTTALVAVTTASIVAPMSASAAPVNGTTQFGEAVAPSNAQRHIMLTADTRYVNVDDGDTVEFQTAKGNFTWHFDTLVGESAFDLNKIAPAGTLPRDVTVYVGANPLYRG
jgi:hypothetical protein